MKRNKRLWNMISLVVIPCLGLLIVSCVLFFVNQTMFYISIVVTAAVFAFVAWRFLKIKKTVRYLLSSISKRLSLTEQASLSATPLPVLICSQNGEIIWYNELFRKEVLKENDMYGDSVSAVIGGIRFSDIADKKTADITCFEKRYTIFISKTPSDKGDMVVLYYVENTKYKKVLEEHALSRPAVLLFYIDNMDELLQNARDSERAKVSSKVETLLEDWVSSTTGLLRKFSTDRFVLIVEQRHLQIILSNKFDILDKVRSVQTGDNQHITLSIGVGQGDNIRHSEKLARQAIEMALGRGGDQAAIKTQNGFDFYGGISRGVERRTKVRTRVVASALLELLESSENVLVMGHKYSDLDCLGSATAFASCVRTLGNQAHVVVRREQTLAPELIERYEEAGYKDLFVEPEQARTMVTKKTLLIITDTHNPKIVECDEIRSLATTVVVIDHHRKMVDHIDDAVIFYHEPYASSASEMVAELLQYIGGGTLSKIDAESLLAGIMLDTRSFVVRVGVRTYEAAAYLRRMGADTIEVKRLFSGTMETYKQKSEIIASAQQHKKTAIACSNVVSIQRIAAAQAADELLYIKGVDASFVLFDENGTVNISARSLGDFNVQLVMEALGGGGHMTMAGAQLSNTTVKGACALVMQQIDRYIENRKSSV